MEDRAAAERGGEIFPLCGGDAGGLFAADGKKDARVAGDGGKFAASEGLQAIDDGDDLLMAVARELVTEKGIGETADAVWKQLRGNKRRCSEWGERQPRVDDEGNPDRIATEVLGPPPGPMP